MTYFAFLLLFVASPTLVLFLVTAWERRRGASLPPSLHSLPPGALLAILAAIALFYTTPWDNYLVATRVWWYDPALVSGVVLGWVPLEEYLFFILQPFLTGLWFLFLARRLPVSAPATSRPRLRAAAAGLAVVIWLAAIALLISGWPRGTYLALILFWALPPIALQLAFGADLLWRGRTLVIATILSATLYLCAADALAIRSGTWTIDPAQSLGIFLPAGLPVEEALFFFLTNTLLVFGLLLGLSVASRRRLPQPLARVLGVRTLQPE